MRQYFTSLFALFAGFAISGICSDTSIATWSGFDSSFIYPFYSIYDDGAWSSPLTIGNPGDFETVSVVSTALNTVESLTMAVWTEYPTNRPVYAIFSNKSWNTPTYISTDVSIAGSDIYVSFDPIRNIFLATWSNTTTSPGRPYYSVYSHGTWSPPEEITGGIGTNNNVTSSFNSNLGAIIVSWQDITSYPYYAIYTGSMSAGDLLENSVFAVSDVFSTFDASTNTTIATWVGGIGSIGYSSSYSTSWNTPLIIPSTSGEFAGNIACSYNPILQEVIATWADGAHSHQVPLYSTYNGISWTIDQEISPAQGSSVSIFSSFNETINQTIAVMSDEAAQPMYSIYNGTSWSTPAYISTDPMYGARSTIYIGPIRLSTPPYPPSNLSGSRKKNSFGTLYEYCDTIRWNLSNSSSVTSYIIYANDIKIAQVGPNTNHYENHNQKKSASITYTVTAVDSSGNQSSSIAITIN
jgi:hypothetical protein